MDNRVSDSYKKYNYQYIIKIVKRLLGKLLPQAIIKTLNNFKILSLDYGQFKTMNKGCINKYGEAIPWYTYPAIEYIKQLDFSDKTVFEYGSGNSTIFWAKRCRYLFSIEDNQEWYDKMNVKLPENVEYKLFKEKQKYIESIHNCPDGLDLIIIDGNHRYECAVEALKKINGDGFIILDNSDWHQKTSKLLRDADLIEIDMSGFGPINGYTWTTSFFFSRNVKLKQAYDRQPVNGIGSLLHREV